MIGNSNKTFTSILQEVKVNLHYLGGYAKVNLQPFGARLELGTPGVAVRLVDTAKLLCTALVLDIELGG